MDENPPNGSAPDLSVIVPVFREARNIRPFLERLIPVIERLGSYEVLFAVDPGGDDTERVIEDEIARNKNIGMIVFSRRFGQPAACMTGILQCRGKACVVIDVDLQDPPELIETMLHKLAEGFDVVYAKRRTRKGETLTKRIVSHLGYKLINMISDVEIPRNTGDFRIMSRRVIEELRPLRESHGFLRGLVAFVGFRQTFVEYDRDPRAHGRGHYNRYLGSLRIAFNGIVGFSTFFLWLTLVCGIVVAGLAVAGSVYILVTKLFLDIDYPLGIPTITILVMFMGGLQLVFLGILGQYIGRIYDEVRGRPMVIIDRTVNIAPRSLRERHH